MKTLGPQTFFKRLLRPVRFLRLAFFLLMPLAGCDSGLPTEPVEESLTDVLVVLYQDSIGMLTDVVNFEPTFIGRESVMEINVAYLDTLILELSVESSDSVVFQVTPPGFQFSKKNKQVTLRVTFIPVAADTVQVAYLHLQTFGGLLNPDSIMEPVAEDSLQLVGLGQSYYLDLEMVFIPGGSFFMGSGTADDTANINFKNPDELYTHQVALSDFFIGRYEVTNQKYYEFWVEQSDSAYWPEYSSVIGSWPQDALDKPNHPVVGVSWEDAMAFCRRHNARRSTVECSRS